MYKMLKENVGLYDAISSLQDEIQKNRKEILMLREQLIPERVENYSFTSHEAEGKVYLKDLFGETGELVVIHNMGKKCNYCSLWADGFNGFHEQLSSRVPYVVISPDSPELQHEILAKRGWGFRMLSDETSEFTNAMGFLKKDGHYPGFSIFKKVDDEIFRTNYDFFGPGDFYSPIWHIMDMLPNKVNNWQPS